MVRSVCHSVCPFAIETTFPLSNFKTKHIFGILMTLRKSLKLWGAAGTPTFSFFLSFTAARGGVNLAPGAPLTRRAKEIPSKAGVSRVYICIYSPYILHAARFGPPNETPMCVYLMLTCTLLDIQLDQINLKLTK